MPDRVLTMRARARRLRRDQTDAEFCCSERRVVVELDGGHHALQAQADRHRTDFLAERGYRVLRFWDHEVLADPDGVLQQIASAVSNPHPHPLPDKERVRKHPR